MMMGVEVERAHLLSDVIHSIENSATDNFYQVTPLTYSVKKSEDAYKRLRDAGLYTAPTDA
eukprot:11412-Eustigmatos_ZCMA.PRE.1